MAGPDHVALSGMTDGEAKEFHRLFVQGLLGFTVIAIIAHILVWLWRPWIPNDDGTYSSLIDGVNYAVAALTPVLA